MLFAVSLACTPAAAEASVPCISAAPALVRPRIVSVEHDQFPRIERAYDEANATALVAIEYARHEDASQSIDGACWTVMDGVGWWRREFGAIE
jgi:hypothetical protein